MLSESLKITCFALSFGMNIDEVIERLSKILFTRRLYINIGHTSERKIKYLYSHGVKHFLVTYKPLILWFKRNYNDTLA